jgi:hypothetical protein
MRQIASLLFILAPLSCSYQARWNATCDISFSLLCSRMISCGQAFEQTQCEQDLRQQLYCDPSADLDDLKACREAATDQSNCEEAIPEVCLAAMCDSTLGCKDANDPTDPQCGDNGRTPDGQPCEPDGEDTGSTTSATGDTGATY